MGETMEKIQCKSCRSFYEENLRHCPICGEINPAFAKESAYEETETHGENRRNNRGNTEKTASEENLKERVCRATRWMKIALAVTAATIVIGVGLEIYSDSHTTLAGVHTGWEEILVQQGRYEALQSYLYDIDADAEDEDYKEYWSLATIGDALMELRESRTEYLTIDREQYRLALRRDPSMSESDIDYCNDHFDSLIEWILQESYWILQLKKDYAPGQWRYSYYGVLSERGERLLEEAELEAVETLKLVFDMSEDEIEDLKAKDYLYQVELDEYIQKQREEWSR